MQSKTSQSKTYSTWQHVPTLFAIPNQGTEMKLYLSGPMSGKPQFNIPAFDEAAAALRSLGHEVVSPAELDDPAFRDLCLLCKYGDIEELHRLCYAAKIKPDTWGDLLARDVKLLADDGIEGVVVLEGWSQSRGATLETYVARLCDIPIYYLHHLIPVSFETLKVVHGKAAGHGGILHYAPDLSNFPPMGVANHIGGPHADSPLLDTAESVQADREIETAINQGGKAKGGGGVRIISGVTPANPDEIRVTDATTGGQKGSKPAVLGDLDPAALIEVAKVAGFGRKKYARLNFTKGFAWSLSYDALQRHLHQFWNREDIDEESGLHHLAHAAWQCLCLLCFVLRKRGTDDRMT